MESVLSGPTGERVTRPLADQSSRHALCELWSALCRAPGGLALSAGIATGPVALPGAADEALV
jgi:hypothetical protein